MEGIYFDDIFARLYVFQVIYDLLSITVGAGLVFGALKWYKGLITTTSFYWGILLSGVIAGVLFKENGEMIITFMIVGTIGFMILTYKVSGVNRFVVGFIVASKLMFMITTVMAKSGNIELTTALITPLVVGTIFGLFLMSWTRIKISAFVLATAFIGASEVAPIVSKYINQGLFAGTGDLSYLIDPIDIIFSLMKVELTDTTTLFVMIPLFLFGVNKQFKSAKTQLKELGYKDPLSVPLITFETVSKKDHGRIVA